MRVPHRLVEKIDHQTNIPVLCEDVRTWLATNVSGDFGVTTRWDDDAPFGHKRQVEISFDDEEDLVLFGLRWL